jgi:hypothetical protein
MEFSLLVQSIKVITATYRTIVNKNLGDGAPALGAFRHLRSRNLIAINFILSILYALPPQQQFCADAKGTSLPSIDLHLGAIVRGRTIQETIQHYSTLHQ